ncbi:unnamed protein product [Rhizopus stolonifer]
MSNIAYIKNPNKLYLPERKPQKTFAVFDNIEKARQNTIEVILPPELLLGVPTCTRCPQPKQFTKDGKKQTMFGTICLLEELNALRKLLSLELKLRDETLPTISDVQ